MNTRAFTVTAGDKGAALIDVLSERLDLSKRAAKDLLNARNVFVNRKRVWMARHVLRLHDRVEVMSPAPRGPRRRLAVLHEDDWFLVVNKPPGILSNGPSSLETLLRDERDEPALECVHRLDKDTSGCLMLARTPDARQHALVLFRNRAVTKIYRAIVLGYVAPEEQTLRDPLDEEAAVTHLRVLDRNRDASHVALRIETGRTHQIRKHMAGLHHSVVGDRQYGTRARATDKSMRVGRQMLHACELRFPHPGNNQRITRVRAPLPHDFRRCLAMYRLS